jgi:hypothetical protein
MLIYYDPTDNNKVSGIGTAISPDRTPLPPDLKIESIVEEPEPPLKCIHTDDDALILKGWEAMDVVGDIYISFDDNDNLIDIYGVPYDYGSDR